VIYDRAEDAPQPERVMSAQSAYLVTDILADNTDPTQNSIWGPSFQITSDEGRRPATLKTGTTNDFRDLQAFGYFAPDGDAGVDEGAIVTGVWVGNSNFDPIADVFAADGPTFIWHDYMAEVAAHNELPIRDFPRPEGIVELEVDQISGMLPGEHTIDTITEIFAENHRPQQEDTVHQRLRIEAETGKIWQEGCGDYVTRDASRPAERVYLVLGDVEDHHDTWDAANDAWIDRWRGREGQLNRSPVPPLDARMAPTEECTPGEVPTSTPSPSPSPTPSATPEPSPTPVATPTPIIPTPPLPTPTPSPTVAPAPPGG
jgi:membrane peptidoglycan carboxypeptidase